MLCAASSLALFSDFVYFFLLTCKLHPFLVQMEECIYSIEATLLLKLNRIETNLQNQAGGQTSSLQYAVRKKECKGLTEPKSKDLTVITLRQK